MTPQLHALLTCPLSSQYLLAVSQGTHLFTIVAVQPLLGRGNASISSLKEGRKLMPKEGDNKWHTEMAVIQSLIAIL